MSYYKTLRKAPLNPPPFVFQVVWPTLYVLILWSMYTVYRKKGKVAYTPYVIQFALIALWSYTFFEMKCLRAALVICVLLWCTTAYTVYTLSRTVPQAAWLLVPSLLWLTFAAYLITYVYFNNPDPCNP